MTARGNWVVWPKATPAGMALAETPKTVHVETSVHSHPSALKVLYRKQLNKAPEKSWLGKAWDWVKDIDWKKWTSVATTLATLAEPGAEMQGIVYPDVYYVNVFSAINSNYQCMDPEIDAMLQDLYKVKDRFNAWYQVNQ